MPKKHSARQSMLLPLALVAAILAALVPALWVKDEACARGVVGYPVCLSTTANPPSDSP